MQRPSRRGPGLVALTTALAAILVPAAIAAPPEIYPLSSVRRGQIGYGMTTFQGTTPDRFEFEVIGVQKNFLPRQDIILVKSNDPKLQVSGFWRGMSGSPLYIEGKLACAFSYGWSFNKIAMGGCTPLEYMKREGFETKRRSAPGALTPPSTMAQWKQLTPTGAVDDLFGGPRTSWLLSAPMPPRPARATADESMTAAVPLALGGFGAEAFGVLEQIFAGYNVQPMRAGGGGGGPTADGPTEFLMGASISVQLIRGDMSAAGTGTVSYVDGNKVLAFGHPMFQAGEIYAPVTSAEVTTVVASAQFPFVMAMPRRELGSLVQDRQSTIMADTKLKSAMIPVDIYVTARAADGKGTETSEFHVEILDDKFLTPALASTAAMNAVGHFLPDRDHVTAKIDSLVKIKDLGELRFTDYLYANDGAASVIGGARGLRALAALAFNPFAPAKAERVELRVDLTFAADFGEVKALRLARSTLTPGKRNKVTVVMDAPDGTEVTEEVAFDVPMSLAGALVQLEVSAGDSARLDAAAPVDLKSLLAAFRKLLPGNVWAVTLYLPEEGVAVDGIAVRDVPASALDKLAPATRTPRTSAFRPMTRSLQNARRVIGGGSSMLIRVDAAK